MTEASKNGPEFTGFAAKRFLHNPDAPVRYFEPVPLKIENRRGGLMQRLLRKISFRGSQPESEQRDVPRDRFGNRIFKTWEEKAYKERSGEQTKAALLVSREGENFLRDHHGILTDLDAALETFEKTEYDRSAPTSITLDHGGSLRKFGRKTGNSLLYMLETKEARKYIIKVHKDKSGMGGVMQPYSNEMLQTQAISTDLKNILGKAGIELPTFMFASGFVSCTEFVEGRHPTRDELRPRLHDSRVLPAIEDYIRARQDTPLWDTIDHDGYEVVDSRGSRSRETRFKTDNFILRPDGRIVFVDPFAYRPLGAML